MTLPSKEVLLERERRWLRPAGILAIAGALIYAAGQIVPQIGLGAADTDAERLVQFHEHSGQFLLGQTLQGIGFALFAGPLYVLIQAAAGRTESVRRGLMPFAFIGPILIAISSIVLGVGFNDAADTFVDKAPAVEQQARQEAEATQAQTQGEGGKPERKQAGTGTTGTGTTGTDTTGTGTTGTGTTGTGTTAAEPQTPDEAADDARENLADDVIDDNGTLKAGAGLRLPAILSLVFGMIYIPLWSMRTGLLTRFWATLGMALGVSLILLGPLGQIGLVMWFAVIGLMLAGWWPGPRPPAWDAGVATPWPKPGEDLGEPGPLVEGSGREVSEPPLPEEGAMPPGEQLPTGERPAPTGEAEPSAGETQGQRRKKRKRRR
jgi:hypothetical protein